VPGLEAHFVAEPKLRGVAGHLQLDVLFRLAYRLCSRDAIHLWQPVLRRGRLQPDVRHGPVRRRAADDGRPEEERGTELLIRPLDLAVGPIHEHVRAGLDLVEALDRAGNVERAGSAAADRAHFDVVALDQAACLDHRLHRRSRSPLALVVNRNVLQMPLVRLDAEEVNAWQRRRQPRQRQSRLARLHAAAVHAGVDLDQHANPGAGVNRRVRDLMQVLFVINGDLDVGMSREAYQPLDLMRPDDLVRDQDVSNAPGGEHLRFTELGARYADRASLELLVRDDR
jgi:hypothetical protein